MLDIDQIKNKVSIEPCKKGGANFETHVLDKTIKGYRFKPSIGMALFCSVFATVGYGFFFVGLYHIYKTGSFSIITGNLGLLFAGSLFFFAGNFLLYWFFKPIVFDHSINTFYKGFNKLHSKNSLPLNRIVALQIIGETISGENSTYKSFELNLVIDNADRINVIDHGKLKTLIDDAEVLSNFLNIPIWHAES